MLFRKAPNLPYPGLARGLLASAAGGEGPLAVWTDEGLFASTGVCVAFTERQGGVSGGSYSSLNLASHVEDDPSAVADNRRILMEALGIAGVPLVVPRQVHGDRVLSLGQASAQAVGKFRAEADKGADALLVEARGAAALLCFADCVPLVMVAPSGRFAVIHAGWRGVDNGVATAALRKLVLAEPGLSTDASCINVYRGAYIHAECFEVSPDLHDLFTSRFGECVAPDGAHIDLGRALDIQLVSAGVDPRRIADVGQCTVCENGRWFSYRAQRGACGRHAALCVALDQAPSHRRQ